MCLFSIFFFSSFLSFFFGSVFVFVLKDFLAVDSLACEEAEDVADVAGLGGAGLAAGLEVDVLASVVFNECGKLALVLAVSLLADVSLTEALGLTGLSSFFD